MMQRARNFTNIPQRNFLDILPIRCYTMGINLLFICGMLLARLGTDNFNSILNSLITDIVCTVIIIAGFCLNFTRFTALIQTVFPMNSYSPNTTRRIIKNHLRKTKRRKNKSGFVQILLFGSDMYKRKISE